MRNVNFEVRVDVARDCVRETMITVCEDDGFFDIVSNDETSRAWGFCGQGQSSKELAAEGFRG